MAEFTSNHRRWLSWLVTILAVAVFAAWLFSIVGQQTSIDLRNRRVVQVDGRWMLRGQAFNKGDALDRAYVEIQYFQLGNAGQTHKRFTVSNVPAAGEFTFIVGPLTGLDPNRRKQVSVYVGAAPDPYGGM